MTIELRRVCVYCGSSPGRNPAYAVAAAALGEELVARGLGLVYGGGSVGLMGVLADSVLQAGGEVIGIIPGFLHDREIQHDHLTDLRVVADMHERKAMMATEADAFIALPGGIGTFEELFEAWTWTQLGVHEKPIALLDVADFWSPLLALLDQTVTEAFLRPEARAALLYGTSAAEVLDALAAWAPATRSPAPNQAMSPTDL